MKLVRGSDFLKLGEAMAEMTRWVENASPARMEAAVHAGCNAADVHMTCSFPICKCKQIPAAVKAAIAQWEKREPRNTDE